jgi:hypothetical protein
LHPAHAEAHRAKATNDDRVDDVDARRMDAMRAQRTPLFSWTSFLRVTMVALGSFAVTGANGDACTIRIVVDDEDHDGPVGCEGEGEGEPLFVDTDGDGLDDETERALGTDPRNPDSDFDGILDGAEACFGFTDGRADAVVAMPAVLCTDPLNADSDFDGLTDSDELYVTGTDPLNPDSDGDGIPDGQDSNWIYTNDSDGDGLDDDTERAIGTDPYNADSDGDGLLDGQESCARPLPPPPCPADVDVGVPVCDPGYVAVPVDGVDGCGREYICVLDGPVCPDIYIEPPTCAEGEIAVALDVCALEWACVAADGRVDEQSGAPDRAEDAAPQEPVDAAVMPWACTDPLNADSDFDGLKDADELYVTGTDPLNPDSDGDGILDGEDR